MVFPVQPGGGITKYTQPSQSQEGSRSYRPFPVLENPHDLEEYVGVGGNECRGKLDVISKGSSIQSYQDFEAGGDTSWYK